MQAIETRLLRFHDAVMANDGMVVQKILADNIISKSPLTIKMITGMLVIAVENSLSDAGQAILAYNSSALDKITDKHLDSIMRLAAQKNNLPSVKVTIH